MDLMGTCSVFELVFDQVSSRWVKWSAFRIDENGEISGSMTVNGISNREIVRLNPSASGVVNTKLSGERKDVHIPESLLFLETKGSKVVSFFSQFFASYAKPLVLIAQSQTGVTSLVRHTLKNL